ncbi:MAG: glutathione S-transferase family protein [Oceanospirillaceae bacterium]|nr:glutathione S-transferase family protein [Oceanospirillaceae bacterium]
MYTLFYSPGACSLATHVVLNELQQKVNIIDAQQQDNFKKINPVGAVPVLLDGDKTLTEGAAILLHLLTKHKNSLFPENAELRQQAVQDMMFANATMHPAYNRLFFLSQNVNDTTVKQAALDSAAQSINQLWGIIEQNLTDKPFLGGDSPSAADILLSVYSRWGQYFPVEIVFGDRTLAMLNAIQDRPSFKLALAEQLESSK